MESKLDAIWQYCVNDWCRFCVKKISDKDRKNKHQQRYATAFLWEFVRSVSFSQSPEPPVKLERQKQKPQANLELLQRNGTGFLLSYCAALRMNADDIDGHIIQCFNLVKEQIYANYKKNRKEYVRKIETRRNAAYVNLWQ